jgi:hypothetical protein
MGNSRQCASKWVNRYRRFGEASLADRPELRGRHGLGHETDLLLVRRTGSPAGR